MKSFINYINEEEDKVWKATLHVKNKEGKSVAVPVESKVNIRKEVHATMKKMGRDGFTLDKVDYID